MNPIFDTKIINNPLPYNILDKNNAHNRQGLQPSYQYLKKRVVWLNSAFATSVITNGATVGNIVYYEFSFDIPTFELFSRTKLSVLSYTINENTSRPSIIKIKNLQYDTISTWNSDNEGFPTLFTTHTGASGMTYNDKISIILTPQVINNITIKITDDFKLRDNGFIISAAGLGHFIICLLFEDDQLIPDNIVSPYK